MSIMKIKTKDDRRDRIQLRQRKRIAGTERAAAAERVPQRGAHLRAGDRRPERPDAGVGVELEPALKGAFAKDVRGGNVKGAEAIGKAIAERSIEKGIKRVVFDRSGFLYHGRIRAVADAARKAGLEF